MTPYKLCPTEASKEMTDAAADISPMESLDDYNEATYSAMLAAAPNIEYVLASELEALAKELRAEAGMRSDSNAHALVKSAARIEFLIAKHKGE